MKTRTYPIAALPALWFGLWFACAAFASPEIPWYTVSGGGGTSASAGGHFRIEGTAGQPDAGLLVGTAMELSGGFWYADIAFCNCLLQIFRSGSDVTIAWPGELNGCILEYADELKLPPQVTVWHPVSPPASGHSYTVAATQKHRYFRLRSP